jgi:deoxyribonuclease V
MKRMTAFTDLTHPWDLLPDEAARLQRRLAARILSQPLTAPVTTVAGVDTAYKNSVARAAAVVLSYPGLELLAEAVVEQPVAFPYVPGLLAFREGPAVLAALARLAVRPDLVLVDGQGEAHPRGCGLACHVGLLANLPTIGCAKTLLFGSFTEPGPQRGSCSLLKNAGRTIGAVVRTRTRVAPLFVSVGHRVSLTDSIRMVLSGCRGMRRPEALRRADRLAAFSKSTAAEGCSREQ